MIRELSDAMYTKLDLRESQKSVEGMFASSVPNDLKALVALQEREQGAITIREMDFVGCLGNEWRRTRIW